MRNVTNEQSTDAQSAQTALFGGGSSLFALGVEPREIRATRFERRRVAVCARLRRHTDIGCLPIDTNKKTQSG